MCFLELRLALPVSCGELGLARLQRALKLIPHFLFAATILLADCERFTRKKINLPPPATTFGDDIFHSVTPTVDGGAYALGFGTGLWYFRGAHASRVQFPSPAPDSSQSMPLSLHITPSLDGGAYATSALDKSVWYLRGTIAQRVSEVPSLSGAPLTVPVSAFPLYIFERDQRLSAEQELEERPSPNEREEPESDFWP